MMDLSMNSFNIRCSVCGEVITILKDKLDVDTSFYDHGENGMGEEMIYDIHHEMECPECGNRITIYITGSEYPIGAYDYDKAERRSSQWSTSARARCQLNSSTTTTLRYPAQISLTPPR